MKPSDIFETQTCTRCGGSGHYSYNQKDGTRCYGCSGSGRQFTKRGAAAYAFYTELQMKPAAEIVVGDNVLDSFNGKWHKVTAIEVTAEGKITLVTDGLTLLSNSPEYKIRTQNKATVAEQRAKAVAYQATLTQAGKPKATKKGR